MMMLTVMPMAEEEFGRCDGESDLISSPLLRGKSRSPSFSSRFRRVAKKRRLLNTDRAHLLFCEVNNTACVKENSHPARKKNIKKKKCLLTHTDGHFFQIRIQKISGLRI